MHLLLVAATPFEVAPTEAWLRQHATLSPDGVFQYGTLEITILITGVGIAATSWALGQYFAKNQPELALNAGVAGTLDPELVLGTVVHVVTECFADLGVEEADGTFTDLFALGLLDPDAAPYTAGLLRDQAAAHTKFLPQAHGITVQKVHGYAPSIAALRTHYPAAQVESMEGAAFFHACLLAGVPFVQIRSISNPVEPRNRANWNLPLALDRLHETLVAMIESLT